MFTGIVQGSYPVIALEKKSGLISFVINFGTLLPPPGGTEGVRLGASVAIDGVCLTVTKIDGERLSFDVMKETLDKTTLRGLLIGSNVNVERSAALGDEIGGHLMSGHITTTAEIVSIDQPENNFVLTFKVAPELTKYILPKGFIGLNGCSLTVVDVDKNAATFTVWLIPETLRVTTFATKKVGDFVNLEIDSRTQAIIDTVENYLTHRI
jgi:riboflavin synthase